MKILEELLASLDDNAPVKEVRQGPFQTAVSTRFCGLASTPHEFGHHGKAPVKAAGSLIDMDSHDLARLALSESLFEAAIGMAAINSLLNVDEASCQELNAGDLIAEKGAGRDVTIVGHFPFIPSLRDTAKNLWVLELNPREGDLEAGAAPDIIPQSDVVAITGTAFTNHTMEGLLALCRPDAYVVVLGDTTPLSPLLFSYGINALSGTRVVEADTVMRYVSQGATYRQLRGIRRLTMTATT